MGKNDDPSLLELFCKLKYGNKAMRRGCLLSYSQAEPEKELTQPRKHLLAEPCISQRENITQLNIFFHFP